MDPPEPFRSAPKPIPAKQILVVDDDRTTVLLMVTRLRSHGFVATAAYDGMQAVMYARRTAPDAILLDLNMPGGSGLDVLRRLRAMTPTAATPILIVSGHVSSEARRCARELGVEVFLSKPVDFVELMESVDRALLRQPPVIAQPAAPPLPATHSQPSTPHPAPKS